MQTGRQRGPESQVTQENLHLLVVGYVHHDVGGKRRPQLEAAVVGGR